MIEFAIVAATKKASSVDAPPLDQEPAARILLLGPQTNRRHPTITGGTVAFHETMREYLSSRCDLSVHCIDTNKVNYGGRLKAALAILHQGISEMRAAEVLFINGSANDYLFLAPLLVARARQLGVKTVLRKFAGDFDQRYARWPRPARAVVARMLRAADVLFWQTRNLVEFGKLFNPISLWFPNVRPEPPAALIKTRPRFERRFVFVGHVVREKGMAELKAAAEKLPESYSVDVYGPLMDPEIDAAWFAGSRIVYRGAVPREQVLARLAEYSVLVLPSWREGHPGIIIEALSLGLPVVATRVGGIPELVEDGVNGFLVEPRDAEALRKAMLRIGDENYATLSAAARSTFSQFESKSVYDRFFEQVVALAAVARGNQRRNREDRARPNAFRPLVGTRDCVRRGLRLFETVRWLKPRQLLARILRLVRLRLGLNRLRPAKAPGVTLLRLGEGLPVRESYREGVFTFLNRAEHFTDGIDWECGRHGRLWTYNLGYFDFLRQQDMGREEGLALIRDFLRDLPARTTALDPYPLSLRGVNWIRFLSRWQVQDHEVLDALYAQYRHLHRNVEYHLMGNHLLENAFSLLFAGQFFCEHAFGRTAARLLRGQLAEQILDDGAHFELSPMYHSIILERLLDANDLLTHSHTPDPGLATILRNSASSMASWLRQVTFSDGSLPAVNDTVQGIASSPADLLAYADSLAIQPDDKPLGSSGYRMFRKIAYEAFVDVGHIGPDYQPAHAHSDTLNLLLQAHDQPFIVDTGISTYDDSPRRRHERGTAAHNTVVVDGEEQSDLWSAFRAGRRAKIVHLRERSDHVSAIHDGYRRLGCLHSRELRFGDNEIQLVDRLESSGGHVGQHAGLARFHLHPDVRVHKRDATSVHTSLGAFVFAGHADLSIQEYECCNGYNCRRSASVLLVNFRGTLRTKISV